MAIRKYLQNNTARRSRCTFRSPQAFKDNRADTDLVLGKLGLLDSCGVGEKGPRTALEGFHVGATAAWRQALARLGERPTAEGRARRGLRSAWAADRPPFKAGCGRALGVRSVRYSGRAPDASLPRPASSPYHVAPPNVEEVSIHHRAVAASLLGHAEQLRVLHPRRR